MDGFDLQNNRLRIFVDLDLDAEQRFEAACAQLLNSEGDPVVLDLTEVSFIGSAFFGQMFHLHHKLSKQGRSLHLRVSPRTHSIMELLGLPDLLNVEVVSPSE